MNEKVYWYETNQANLDKVRELVALELEEMRRLHDVELLRARHSNDVAHKLSEKYAKQHPINTKVYARVISIAYQQKQVAGGVSPKGNLILHTIEPEWKLLVIREDDGRLVEKKPSEVTAVEHSCD